MVMHPVTIATLAAVGVALVVLLAEWLHAQRTRRVARLAFGTSGTPRVWTHIVPTLRVLGAFAAAWGLVVLVMQEPEVVETRPTKEASKHLLICLDASPSMYVADAGPDGDAKRAVWAGEVLQAILDRLDTETTRVTVFAVYTKAIPVIEDTFDLNVVRNLLDGLPLFAAFSQGTTQLTDGIGDALDYARRWEPDSATLVIISDGDADNKKAIRFVPSSIADTIVIGVGDPTRPTLVAGHRSKQNTASLRTLASQLKGVYHQGNTKHLPSGMLDRLTMIRPRVTDAIGLRELAFAAIGFGGLTLSMIGPALSALGRRRAHTRVARSPRNIRTTTPQRVAPTP
jgi:Ca-activated chloride channel homolog